MRQIKYNHIFQIVYPIIVYFVVYQIGVVLLYYFLGAKYGTLLCMLIAALACLVPLYGIYKRVPHLISDDSTHKKNVISYIAWVLGVVLFGLILNVIITKSGLIQYSPNFESASNTLADGSFILKILCNALVIPILEELLIRGIVAGQLCIWQGPFIAVLISSICFGILHNNIVQFLYAVLVGIAIGTMYIKTKRLSLCMVAHGLINFLVIILANL